MVSSSSASDPKTMRSTGGMSAGGGVDAETAGGHVEIIAQPPVTARIS